MPNHKPEEETMGAGLSRRNMLMKLGIAATAAYAAPVMLKLGEAHASGGSGGGRAGGFGGGQHGGGPGNAGRGGFGRGSRGSFSGFSGRRTKSRSSSRTDRRTFRLRSLFT